MTDNGLAALSLPVHDLLDSLGYCGVRGVHLPWNDVSAIAAAILGERGVFLPDGRPGDSMTRYLEAEADVGRLLAVVDQQAEAIATLRAALAAAEALLAAAFSGDDYWTTNSIPMEAPRGVVRKVRALRAALATAKEAGG